MTADFAAKDTMNNDQFLELITLQQQTINELQLRLERLERAAVSRTSPLDAADGTSNHEHQPEVGSGAGSQTATTHPMSRRRMLATAASVGGGLLLVRGAQPAAAATGNNLILGQTNDANATTTLNNTGAAAPATLLLVSNTSNTELAEGVSGRANGSRAAGVVGLSDTGYGVYGDSQVGYSLYAGGNGRIGLGPHLVSGPPSSGGYGTGDIIRDASGNVFVCVTAGTPGSWKKIVGPQTAGAFHLVNPSFRVVDSRNTGGLLTNGERTISVAAAGVPSTATAISVNITTTETNPAGGWATLFAPATGWNGTSTINWAAATTIANGAITAISTQQVTVKVSGSCHFILDVTGYWA